MNTAMITIKTEPQLKAKAQKTASEMGLTLTSVINRYLKHFITAKTITFRQEQEEIPNARTRRILAKAEKDWKEGKVSPGFDNIEDNLRWLEKQGI